MLVGRSAGHKFLRVRTDPAHPGRDRASLGLDSPFSPMSLLSYLSFSVRFALCLLSLSLSRSLSHLCSCISCSERRRNVETRVQSGPTPTLAYRGPFNSPSLFPSRPSSSSLHSASSPVHRRSFPFLSRPSVLAPLPLFLCFVTVRFCRSPSISLNIWYRR